MCLTSLDLSPSLRERAFKIRLRGWLLGSICIGVWGWGLLITFEYTRHKTPQNTLNHLKTILVQQRVTDFTLVQVMESVSWSVRILWWFHPDMQRLWCHQSSASFFQTRQTYRHPPHADTCKSTYVIEGDKAELCGHNQRQMVRGPHTTEVSATSASVRRVGWSHSWMTSDPWQGGASQGWQQLRKRQATCYHLLLPCHVLLFHFIFQSLWVGQMLCRCPL